MRLIKRIDSSTVIEIGEGRFDGHCVYINTDGQRVAPKDIDYFDFLINMKDKYGPEKIYDDFIPIYQLTTKTINTVALDLIEEISRNYEECNEYKKWLTVLYLAMIAEENKANTLLGKKIKRLGIHQILFDNYDSVEAANFSVGMKAREILIECENYGFK
ncbi:hypothetical protein PT052_08675 [Erysipelothrix rhusiopathiae]|nr:hypothetical protein [Erysipelothrix rhusiopathiae]MDE9421733.1 hypothetical protein [Erysipelothrix rhusiopathiae]